MTILLCCTKSSAKTFTEKLKKYDKVKVIETTCVGLDESQPVVVSLPDGTFYGDVTEDRIIEVMTGHAFDIKLQTAKLYDINMGKYMSEKKYRDIIKEFHLVSSELETYTKENIKKTLNKFCNNNDVIRTEVVEAIKMALLKTTKGPDLETLLESFGKKEVSIRINEFLAKYRNRI